jgi:hypothetical protein
MCAVPILAVVAAPATGTGSDSAAIRQELSRPIEDLQRQGPEALRVHIEQLTRLYLEVEQNDAIPRTERRAVSEQVLDRAIRARMILRDGKASPAIGAGGQETTALSSGLSVVGGVVGIVGANPILLLGLAGAGVIAFSLGSLNGYRRGASQASYYVTGDPRVWFTSGPLVGGMPEKAPAPITLPRVRAALAEGRSVLMQLGSEIARSRREEYLRLTRRVRDILDGSDGRSYTVWEDPRRPNRFYENLVCRRLDSLGLLTDGNEELAGLAAGIEQCRVSGAPVQRRIWYGAIPDSAAPEPQSADRGVVEGDGRS